MSEKKYLSYVESRYIFFLLYTTTLINTFNANTSYEINCISRTEQ